MKRYIGLDLGAESISLVELAVCSETISIERRVRVDHNKNPQATLKRLLSDCNWEAVQSAAVTGRFSRQLTLPHVPLKQALCAGLRHVYGIEPTTLVSIGSHGFSVLELRGGDITVFRENSRCSQGTGNFLRQLVERFDMDIESASVLCESVTDPAPLSGRCPVILKTDMTHLANKGEGRERILAGLFDAVCENVRSLINPRKNPPRLVLAGGVCQSPRIRENFYRFAEQNGMQAMPWDPQISLYLEAIGAALVASESQVPVPSLEDLINTQESQKLESIPALADYLHRVQRMAKKPPNGNGDSHRKVIVGFDIGSTGSKAVALDVKNKQIVWEGYRNTYGNPVTAARALMEQFIEGPAGGCEITGLGATGSGREIVGSLLATCYGTDCVFVVNEIAAHAAGAVSFDKRVDTIIEIGGQDAKYIRLNAGRVVDAAMNEACSAGTGSFIEEQGKRFSGIECAADLGREALASDGGVSLGQHCSVFMAEIIDEAVASGVAEEHIMTGIYDSVVQNYLNRVKGNRDIGETIFCQGMPFAADALAAAVARQTGANVIVPPNPGTVGALGIALIAERELKQSEEAAIDPQRLLKAEVIGKEIFICKSQKGCGEPSTFCRIDRLRTRLEGKTRSFTWGGACSLWDKGTGRKKLPDLAADPFREREQLMQEIRASVQGHEGRQRVALTEEFALSGLFPFFATYIKHLGFDLTLNSSANQTDLKRGIEEANIPYCAPMQLYHGVVSKLAEQQPEFLFLPMLRSVPHIADEEHSVVCPIVQGSADILRADIAETYQGRILSPVINTGIDNLTSKEFLASVAALAAELGIKASAQWKAAHEQALRVQAQYDSQLQDIGRRALKYCTQSNSVAVVVLGRGYTIYNKTLNSNLPAILREQGAIAIPVDCYPVDDNAPTFSDIFWAYSQRNLRAVQQIRSTPGHYSLWASNYACGPDSFNLHFYAHLMKGKPYAVIETDGHSGDAGTKTRVEAFLHCVREDLNDPLAASAAKTETRSLTVDRIDLESIKARGDTLLIPRLGEGTEALAACIKGFGIDTEALPPSSQESIRIGRRLTSGKECLPVCLTLGSLHQRLEAESNPDRQFAFLMPSASGPCRFGVYNLLHSIVLERLGWKDRVRLWSPKDSNYFEGVPGGFTTLIYTGLAASDALLEALHDTRPSETQPGAANNVYRHYRRALLRRLQTAASEDVALSGALIQVAHGGFFGVTEILSRAAHAFARIRTERQKPTVLMVGEIYVRCNPFASNDLVEKLEERGLRVRLAPFSEWLEYVDYINRKFGHHIGFDDHLSSFIQRRIQARTYSIIGDVLGWHQRTSVVDTSAAAKGMVREELECETILSVGGPLHEWRTDQIDGAVNVCPLECLPSKIAEAQLFHAAENEGLLSLTLPVTGDPIDPEILDNFAYEVHSKFNQRQLTAGNQSADSVRFSATGGGSW